MGCGNINYGADINFSEEEISVAHANSMTQTNDKESSIYLEENIEFSEIAKSEVIIQEASTFSVIRESDEAK